MAEKRPFDSMSDASPEGRSNDIVSPSSRTNNKGIDYPRKRVSIACEVCRARRTRCDAKKPACSYCTDAGIECTYRKPNLWDREPLSATKDVLTRLEGRMEIVEHSLQTLLASLDKLVSRNEEQCLQTTLSPPETVASSHTAASVVLGRQNWEAGNRPAEFESDAKPTLPSLSQMTHPRRSYAYGQRLGHRMPTLLTFNGPPSLGSFAYNDSAKFFESQLSLENGLHDRQHPTFARLDLLHISARRQRSLQYIFASDYLSWMPLFDTETYSAYASYAETHMFGKTDSMTCITLFSYAIAGVLEKKDILYDARYDEREEELWYAHAAFILEQLQWSLDDTGVERIMCRILQACYMLSLMRPLRAWSCISTASRDCMLLLKTAWRNRDKIFRNQVARVYWACYVLENELEICLELQPTGLRAYQAEIPLPSSSASRITDIGQGSGLYYFLAIATLRRLLTDAVETVGFESGSAIYAPLVALELRSQLQSWYNHLPPSLKFPIDTSTIFDPHKAHLRTQYFGLIATISWPFLLRILESSHHSATSSTLRRGYAIDPEVEAQAKECLMICILHLRTVEGTLLHKTIVSHTTLRSTCAIAMILLLVYPSPICGTLIEEIPAAISMAYEALKAWSEIPFMITPLERFRNLAEGKGIQLLDCP